MTCSCFIQLLTIVGLNFFFLQKKIFSEMDNNIRHRHATTFQNGVLEPIMFDEKYKAKKPVRISPIKVTN